jgi:hypothetical protein
MHLKIGGREVAQKVGENEKSAVFRNIDLPAGPIRLEAWVAEGGSLRGVRFVAVRRTK